MNTDAPSFDKAKNKALNILSRRMHTKKELFDKLLRQGFLEGTASDVCEWACEYGFINDKEYARAYIQNCIVSKKYGIKRIKQALLYKGVDAYTIEDVIYEFDFCEKDTLISLAEKKLNGNFEHKNIDKTIRHFIAKGYEFSDIKGAISSIKEDFDFGKDD
ncbi:MAG: regulatory protein RecX [Ruminococcaceae bacterium]|nr:regulatory protein RecX [Oscillospiraceae bacterium]